jgi:Holliday junction DNA helicase RuvA
LNFNTFSLLFFDCPMISLLRGVIRFKAPYQLVLDVGGTGYEVLCTLETYERAPAIGKEYEVLTRLIVREDSLTLFGFSRMDERALFDQITSVSGIGPKTGLSILSSIGSDQLREAIRSSDIPALIGVPGVGRKTAERMIVELRDKFLKEETLGGGPVTSVDGSKSQSRADALQALIALGYARPVAEKAIRMVVRDDPASSANTESLVRAALKHAVTS